ncbi:4-hydroxy-tetrahydrodipicolinate synthase [Serinicoccus hydrothermalis]|uniref:4-hydroxy-tetrahydrodipicolinate synthase n=1 Tax=Serinicoccus hydrothermalis TaxID=1758689 RepID=A0A1B1NEE0_9MICO|nr:4-hydroxy-tetrahydrodipicolinate synthase [Serinicoccus hydrothermalis]ANS79773.1 4-hydroxy-tetrahydrodipicolinate synthase [Serinicoccus hydrothermalis]
MSTSLTAAPFTGLGVALATPFTTGTDAVGGARKPAVDHEAFGRLVEHVLVEGHGVDWLVVLGSTGEAATITDVERHALVRQAVELARRDDRRIPVVVGVGHNDTERTCELAGQAAAAGADALLVVTPFYNKPQVSGLVAHYRAVADAAPGLPIIAYNVPGRTGCNITPAALRAIWEIDQVVAIKESSGDLRQVARMCQEAPQGRAVLAGDDDLALAGIAVGAQGLVSVCANVVPTETRRLVHAAMAGDLPLARESAALLAPTMAAMFVETNPVPVKAALACLGLATAQVRLPLSPAEPDTWSQVQTALADLQTSRRSGSASIGRLPEWVAVPHDTSALAS